jgi:two-component system sensor histidine kinase KdpD
MTRGRLRVYLGCAPGVGKTFAMLDEGHRRKDRGSDVVVAFVETHGRVKTAGQVEGLELMPRKVLTHRGARFEEMDLEGVLARHPQLALVDELAHTNVPGSSHTKRWEDVEQILAAGIDVVTTVNVQHLESLNDVVEEITGVPQRETVPDAVVRAADQIELVDMSPESLRRRMAHGNVYAPEKVDAALGNYFRVGNLTALRELALLWLAGNVEDRMQRYREAHGIAGAWETRERVVVALTGGPEGDTLLRRAARIAARGGGGEVMALHVARSDGLAAAGVAGLSAQRLLIESLGGSYHSVVGDDVPAAILDFARSVDATQVVIGASRRGPLATSLSGPGTGATITRIAGSIDVHVVSHDYVGRTRLLPPLTGALSTRRRLLGGATGAVLLGVLTPLTVALRHHSLGLSSDLLLFLLAVIVVSLVGGFWPALAAAIVGSLLVNYFLVPPVHTLSISQPDNILALLVFLLVAASVSRVVDLAAARSVQAARAGAEAATISALAGSVLRGEDAVEALLQRLQETFAMRSVALLRRTDDRSWQQVATVGRDPAARPEDAEVSVGDDLVLALRGRELPAGDQRVLAAFAAQVTIAYRQRQLAAAAASAAPLAASARLRTALLNAVSHDLRTPLASAKAAISSLRDPDVPWSAADERELLANADTALDRLTALVTDLLDMSRLEADALPVSLRPVFLDDIVSRVLDHLDVAAGGVGLDVPDSLPPVAADPGLLERVVANVIQNALRHAPAGSPVRLAGSEHAGIVELRVIDRGPGIPEGERARVLAPFQRTDESTGPGVGLGLAIAHGFTEAMHGELRMEDTPGGGLTMVVALPVIAP